MATFAEQLTAARKAAGMTQEDIANAVHVARSTVSSWEKGRTQPDVDTMRLLGQTLQFDFLNGEAAPVGTVKTDTPINADAASGESTPIRKLQKKKIVGLCTAVLVILVAAVALLISHNAKMSKTAVLTLAPLENPAPMIVDPDFEPDGLGWMFTFVATNESDVPFRPSKATMLY